MSKCYYIGVDVGTSSVRAALVTGVGQVLSTATHSLRILEPDPDYFEQSSENIWDGCCKVIRSVSAGVNKDQIHGLGFDATCSLVVLDKHQKPLSISSTGNNYWNVIMWMDHRAAEQAEAINQTKHSVLQNVGGLISLEMETPKLLWIKQNLPSCWERAGHFFDLPDYLTWKATGCMSRSLCSLVCKWTYQMDCDGNGQWSDSYFTEIGLGDLVEEGFAGIGLYYIIYLTYDSYTISDRQMFVPGVWGPYCSVLLPNLWAHEGGQSAAGKLIDHIIEGHPASSWLKEDAAKRRVHIFDILQEVLEFMAKKKGVGAIAELTQDIHVWPDYHGNRSPLADPSLRGMVSGLTLAKDAENLALLYLATVQALAYSTRHILATMTAAGHNIRVLSACGGLSKCHIYIQTHSDVTGLPVLLPKTNESVLLGSAILGASASGNYDNIKEAMLAMGGKGHVVKPDFSLKHYHEKKYEVFLLMLQHQQQYKQIMADNKH
ncbi:hypothetical protein LSH36_145g04069 [Paralvinella palmiformis]|uniref:FGGY carbohydrate kinase domain-containing protein n=1 Tax=Paralvinella palmiformis TaxID=53620 RepID=A0AAD9JVZ0_9ANNE|nr:hypothetical protein LSH36_145g04069 [Paralvinella palmiformis]